jgi:hypothetical protein
LVKETVAALAPLLAGHQQEREAIELLIRLLEALAFQFGKLVRTIPTRLLTTTEVESMRYRSSAFRRRRGTIAAIRRFTRRYGARAVLAATLLATAYYHMHAFRQRAERHVPLKLIENLPVLSARLDARRLLHLVIRGEEWRRISYEEQRARLLKLMAAAQDERGRGFKVTDEQGVLLAVTLFDSRDRPYNTLLVTR